MGNTSASTSPSSGRKPKRRAMTSAAAWLSPEIMTSFRPLLRNAASACAAPGLGSSPNAINNKPCTPSEFRSAKADKVAPVASNSCTSAAQMPGSMPSWCNQRRLPSSSWRPAKFACTPRPGTAIKSSGGRSCRFWVFAACTTARAKGCSLPLCTLAAHISAVSAASPGAAMLRVNRGWPTVKVPVLSKATVLTWCAISRACASLINMPFLAATPVPAMMATGVASPSAHGQAMTSTATAWMSAVSNPAPKNIQVPKVNKATAMTTGTKTSATWSTSR